MERECGLTTREPTRAGVVALVNLHHLDELRYPAGVGSGEQVMLLHACPSDFPANIDVQSS